MDTGQNGVDRGTMNQRRKGNEWEDYASFERRRGAANRTMRNISTTVKGLSVRLSNHPLTKNDGKPEHKVATEKRHSLSNAVAPDTINQYRSIQNCGWHMRAARSISVRCGYRSTCSIAIPLPRTIIGILNLSPK